jgi:hypothetical protein
MYHEGMMRRNVSASIAFWRRIDKAAKAKGLSSSAFIRLVVTEALNEVARRARG